MTKSFSLYTVYHKKFYLPTAEFVVPIHAGKAISTQNLLLTGDDTGDNISTLNPSFCELTALYWIWKNAGHKPQDIWGLCHYRRYFSLPEHRFFGKPKKLVSKKPDPFTIDSVLNRSLEKEIKSILNTADVIVQEPIFAHKKKGTTLSIEAHYESLHRPADWQTMKAVVLDLYPEYAKSLEIFCKSTTMSFANMMIAKADTWNKYLTWQFNIMFELQKRITISEDPYQARVFGFISERIMNLYLLHEQLKIAYLPITVFDKT